MEQKKFEAMLVLLVPQIVHLICYNYNLGEVAATGRFYSSKVYSVLEQEETKLWHLSALTIYNMYEEEQQTGSFTFPEEV